MWVIKSEIILTVHDNQFKIAMYIEFKNPADNCNNIVGIATKDK